ncbi:MAG TPA: caspase family protein, partial [Caldilineaceae bacterium]|nr:caspase family protein [Caldilineaceae bacterium]
MSNLYALLIGVDFYFPNQLPGGGSYRHLGGCVRDVTHVEAHLRDRLGLSADHIFKLSATNAGGAQPAEPPQQWPTYANMVDAFKQLTALAQPGDRVYIHYAGHGGRTVTAYPDLKSDGLDEGLVPTDIGDAHARYLRDVEMHYLIQAMVEKGLVLTLVLDSCHSGGATRAVEGEILGAVPRGISEIDTTDRPADSLVASKAELETAWQGQSTAQSRAAKSVSGWLLEPKGYTLLAACRASEFAFEYPFNGRESNGALTYWLLDSLRQVGPTFTYKMLQDRILAKVHGQFAQQTPMLQGEGDIVVFGADRIKPYYAVPVLKVENNGERVQLNAGEAHGLTRGAQLAVYPPLTADLSNEAGRIALVEVTDIDAVESWAKVVERLNAQTPIEPGAQAVLLNLANLNFQRNVALDIADSALRQAMETAIQTQGKGFAKLAGAGDPVHFVVERTASGELRIEDAAD